MSARWLLGAVGAIAAYASWVALRESKKAPEVPTPPPAPKASPSPNSEPTMNFPKGVASSNPDTVFLKHPGMLPLSNGKALTMAPLWDPERDTAARLTYRDSVRALARLGLRLPTFEELDEGMAQSLVLQPCTLVQSSSDAAKMATEEFWRRHDDCVRKQLDAAGWHGERAVASWGKHWAYGAPAGRSWLHGWYDPKNGNKPIQNRGKTAHDDRHIDYSSTVLGVRDGSIA